MHLATFYTSIFCICLTSANLYAAVERQTSSSFSYIEQVNLANLNAEEGQFQDALVHLNAAIASYPSELRAYKVRGNVYFAMQDYQAALQDFDYIVKTAPEQASSYLDRSIVYLAMEEYTKALEDADRALEINPKNSDATILKFTIQEAASKTNKRFVRLRAKGEKLRG